MPRYDEGCEETSDLSSNLLPFEITFKTSLFKSKKQFLKRFKIFNEHIGEGSQAYVKKGYDNQKQTFVAIKIFKK